MKPRIKCVVWPVDNSRTWIWSDGFQWVMAKTFADLLHGVRERGHVR